MKIKKLKKMAILYKKINKVIKKYPKVSYIIISKILSIVGCVFFIWLTQLNLHILQTVAVVFCYNIIFIPIGYWLTYCFGAKK